MRQKVYGALTDIQGADEGATPPETTLWRRECWNWVAKMRWDWHVQQKEALKVEGIILRKAWARDYVALRVGLFSSRAGIIKHVQKKARLEMAALREGLLRQNSNHNWLCSTAWGTLHTHGLHGPPWERPHCPGSDTLIGCHLHMPQPDQGMFSGIS